MARIGFIGTGHIAAPMVRFLAAKGHDISVTERSATVSAALAERHGVAVASASGVLDASDIVFLCVRPHQAHTALAGLPWRADHALVSVMAGISGKELHRICAPATRLVQTIPLGFLEQGGCPLAATGATDLLAELFEPENRVVPVASEDALNAHFAICAMVPGLLDLMARGAGWLAKQTGDTESAEFYTTTLLAGFLATMQASLAEERDALATEGTLSLQMTEGLRSGGAHEALTAALTSIGARLREA